MTDLPLRRYSNQAPDGATLNGGMTAADTTLTVSLGSNWPIVPFIVKVENEIMRVTDLTGFVMTVDRAYDNSTPAAIHPSGAAVKHVLTQDDFVHQPRSVIYSPPFGTYDDEFDNATDDLAKVNIGTSTWSEDYGSHDVVFSGQATSEVTANIKSIGLIGIGSGVEAGVRAIGTSNFIKAGVCFSSGGTTTDNLIWQHITLSPDSNTAEIEMRSGTFQAATTQQFVDTYGYFGGYVHMRLVWVGINQYRAWWSMSGSGWTDFGKGIQVITGVNPPTRFGMAVSAWGGTSDKLAAFEYLRIWTP